MLAPLLALAMMQQTAHTEPGQALMGLYFVGGVVYGLVTSKRRWHTLLWSFGFGLAILAVFGFMGYLNPPMAGAYGTLAGLGIGLSVPTIAIVHARKTKAVG